MKNNYKKTLILLTLIITCSTLFWVVYFNNIYLVLNILRDMFYFGFVDYKIIFPFLIIVSFLGFISFIAVLIKKKIFSWLGILIVTNLICIQYPLYFYMNNKSIVLNTKLYYKINERFENQESILDINSYKNNEKKYTITLDIFKSKNNGILLEEKFQSIYISRELNYYKDIGNDIKMEKIYSLNSLISEWKNLIKFKECTNIKNQEVFYFCSKFNIPANIKYKLYLHNLRFTGILNENLWDSKIYQAFVLNNFIHYNESLSNIDLNKMTLEEKTKDKEYREKVRKLLNKYKIDNLYVMKTVDNNIILLTRFRSRLEIFRDPKEIIVS